MASSEIQGEETKEKGYGKRLRAAVILVAVAVISVAVFQVFVANTSKDDSAIRGPIRILTNADFSQENGVTSGSGTESDPFIIDGWAITLMKNGDWGCGVYIGWTTAHFVIRNVTISKAHMNINQPDDSTGILIWGTSNGTISDCHISNMSEGIEIIEANNITVVSNIMSSCRYGVFSDWRFEGKRSSHIEIVDNYFSDNYRGCIAERTDSIELAHNQFSGNDWCVSMNKVDGFVCQDNTLGYYNQNGIVIGQSENTIIHRNSVTATGVCMSLVNSSATVISDNDIGGGHIGLFVMNAGNSSITGNCFSYPSWKYLYNTAIWIECSVNLSIDSNLLEYYHTGMVLVYCTDIDVSNNTFSDVEIETILLGIE